MECSSSIHFLQRRFLFVFLLIWTILIIVNGKIVSTQDEVIAYVNHTGKLSCIIENPDRQHVTWSRVQPENETQKLLGLLFVNSHKYTPIARYHLTHFVDNDKREAWNLEIRHLQTSDQGYYSCVLTGNPPISKLFQLKIVEHTRNPMLALRSTSDLQRRTKDQFISSASFSSLSWLTLVSSLGFFFLLNFSYFY